MTSEASQQIEDATRNELFASYVFAPESARKIRVVPSYRRVTRMIPAAEPTAGRSSAERKTAVERAS